MAATPDRSDADGVAAFTARAVEWLAGAVPTAPPDYGAIMPPDLAPAGVEWQRRLHGAGLTGMDWPTRFGGLGLTPAHHAAWLEACATVGVPPYLNMVGYVLAGGSIRRYGTESQQARHLPRILDASTVWCQLFSEPGAGSDLASLRTEAVADGDGWVLNGQKVWCSGGRVSDFGILLARTDPDAPRHRGISFFLLDLHTPGVEVRPLRQMTGDAEFDEVFFTDVRLPPDALLGPLHGGWGVAMTTLTNERGSVGAAAISLARRLGAMTAALGQRSDEDPVARQAAARLVTRGRALQAMVGRQGPVAGTTASLSKLALSELGFDAADLTLAGQGAAGMLAGPPVRAMLAAPGSRIAGGTSQVQRNIIGERLLGLPKEPAVNDDDTRTGSR
jgi:alkylation response protein AidB-like acyl-CoA dehydrogenase